MRQATWSVGWYSKVVLTIIAVSLVGLLVRQLPGKVEAKPERYRNPGISVVAVALDVPDLRGALNVFLSYDDKLEKEGKTPILDRKWRELVGREILQTRAGRKSLLDAVLHYRYAMGYRVKLMNDDFITLESE